MPGATLSDMADAWARGEATPGLPVRQMRDLTLVELGGGVSLVVACDSLGAIGSKENDIVQAPFQLVGRFTARVALFELLAAGAAPVVVVNALSVEMEPSGRQILEGVREELRHMGLEHVVPITGSTEENMPTKQTGIGLTAIGAIASDRLRIGKAEVGDDLYCIGVPKVGDEVQADDPEMLQADTLRQLARSDVVHDLVPVGSKGVAEEAEELARSAGLECEFDKGCPIDLRKSAGPATAAVAALPTAAAEPFGYMATEPLTWIGTLRAASDAG